MFTIKKLVLESQLNYRFRGTTMSHSELLVALVNIIIDQIATVPTARDRKIDTSAPMEIGMVAKDAAESLREEGDQRIVDFASQNSNAKGYVANMGWKRTHGRRARA